MSEKVVPVADQEKLSHSVEVSFARFSVKTRGKDSDSVNRDSNHWASWSRFNSNYCLAEKKTRSSENDKFRLELEKAKEDLKQSKAE